ncbi:MAG TPA: hypothetical protein VFW46_00440 [Stellaceae bacterium]|nr:hypothetical protein [Stellaceae bacterium]
MRTLVLAAMLLAALWLPARAAEPDQDRISFAQYRDWRVDFIAQRQRQIAAQLAADGLATADRDRLTREKSYYDRQAAMPADQRDRMFQARFELIDTNHDGAIDRAERSAWHDKQQARYRHQASAETRR